MREAAVATVLVFAYPHVLTGPILLGTTFALAAVCAGLGGIAGQLLGRSLAGVRAVIRRVVAGLSVAMMVVLMLVHFTYFTGCTDCGRASVVLHVLLLAALALLSRLVLSLVYREASRKVRGA